MADPVNALRRGMSNRTPSAYTAETAPADLAPLYNALAPAPDTEYGNVLPVARDTRTGERRFAMPNVLREGAGGVLDLLAGVDTGQVTPRAAETLALGGVGMGGTLAPKGALAAGGAPGQLPMDTASRLSRAREMGFGVKLPKYFYHGTDRDFPAFSLSPPDRANLGKSSEMGVWVSEHPDLANQFAGSTAAGAPGAAGFAASERGGSQQVYPLLGRADRKAQLQLTGKERDFEIAATLQDLWDSGYDAVRLTNYTLTEGGKPYNTWVFRNPNQLRSPFAAFDPAKRDSANLLAGRAAPAPVALPTLPNTGQPTPAQREQMNQRVM